ncbi:hypothetical protein RM545_16125 [Zunongwangia sp. F260]|uniref:Type II toxin-antitoxin system RelE/ParE family toxin n=1 Tax=Autumnicola lenta TaxID=3075593 RepID=A0ABU3CPP8_9FLAO|nr:hypothetical protein [Zunongwangia sp. F260]MDT0648222.1 hypothetical protein [Zunongwangia sp. F260]
MAGRKIIWTKTADIQLVGVLGYWVKRNKSNVYSRRLIHLVTDRTKQIAENPFLYKPTNFKNVRVASLGNFSIYYKLFKISDNHHFILGQPSRPKTTLRYFEKQYMIHSPH